ncbi:MAG: nitroreductase family protein [Coriobacteriales bacterium]|jgi:nitroreductase|nr:nitroreductase family protein [Coriobacteriales bacterium]
MGTFAELVTARYSVRKFGETPVEQEKIDQLLKVAQIAPTAHNNQPQRLIPVTTPEKLGLIDQSTPCRAGAPLVFIIGYDRDACWVRPFDGEISGIVDASVITTHLMLEATDLGLGSVWVMHFDPSKLRELFELPDNIIPVALLSVGYSAPDAEPSPRHFESKPLEDLILAS